MRKYNQQIYLKLFDSPKFTTRIYSPVLKVDQSSQLSIMTRLNDLRIGDSNPITIQGVGADGKNRNCTLFIKVISEDQSNPPRYGNNIGVDLLNRGLYKESIQAFDKVIEIDPKRADAWLEKGVALCDLGKYNEAIQAYDRAIELDPQDTDAWNDKGGALGEQGKYDEAIQAFDKAIELDPQYVDAWYNKCVALKALGRNTEAGAAFAQAEELGYKA